MNSTLSNFVNCALPALSGSSVTYNSARNIFLTNGYTSAAGNTYYQGIRLSDRLAIVLDLGQGYMYTFLNGIKLYCFDGTQKKLIGSRSFNCYFYSDSNARREAEEILLEYLESQMRLQGVSVSRSDLQSFAVAQVRAAETSRHRLSA